MRLRDANQLRHWLVCVLLLPAMTACAQTKSIEPDPQADLIRETEQGQFSFASEDIRELSGITYFDHDLFAVVSDKGGKLGMVSIKIDRENGEILEANLQQTIDLEGGRDLEDITINPSNCMLLTVDESDQSLVQHHFPSGKRVEAVAVPEVFKKARSNLGFESVTASPYTRTVWAANEEPLSVDGPRATKDEGALIRLQRFTSDLRPSAQYAYRVDPHRGSDNVIERAQSGVSGLVLLPSGRLIVMERELGGSVVPSFRIRLYLIDAKDATDTSGIDALDKQDVKPVAKTLLYEINTGPANFEGIALGPQLNNGDYTLVLASDNGGQYNPQNLLSLRIAQRLVESMADDSQTSSVE